MTDRSSYQYHKELGDDFQLPSSRPGLRFNIARFGMPVDVLSTVSALLLIFISGFIAVQPELRQLFMLPASNLSLFIISFLISALGFTMGLSFKSRPGSMWARLWLLLAIALPFMLGVSYLVLEKPWRAYQDILLVGITISYFPLLFRWTRAKPESRYLFWVSPTIFVVALLFGVFSSILLGQFALNYPMTTVDKLISDLEETRREIARSSGKVSYGPDFESHNSLRNFRSEALGEEILAPSMTQLTTSKMWADANILDKDIALADSAEQLLEAVAASELRQIESRQRLLKDSLDFDWKNFTYNQDLARKKLDSLSSLSAMELLGSSELWGDIAERDELSQKYDLEKAIIDYQNILFNALLPTDVPRLSYLNDAPIRYDTRYHKWMSNPDFAPASFIVARYFSEVGRLWQELGLELGVINQQMNTPPVWDKLLDKYDVLNKQLKQEMSVIAHNMADSWSLDYLPKDNILEHSALDSLLLLSKPQGNNFTPADFWSVLNMPFEQATDLIGEGSACQPKKYPEGAFQYFRLDCYGYEKVGDQPSAQLSLEYRLVYRSKRNQNYIAARELPVQIYILVPIREKGLDDAEFMLKLYASIEEVLPRNVSLSYDSRSGSVANGFYLEKGNRKIRVSPPANKSYLGSGRARVVMAEILR